MVAWFEVKERVSSSFVQIRQLASGDGQLVDSHRQQPTLAKPSLSAPPDRSVSLRPVHEHSLQRPSSVRV